MSPAQIQSLYIEDLEQTLKRAISRFFWAFLGLDTGLNQAVSWALNGYLLTSMRWFYQKLDRKKKKGPYWAALVLGFSLSIIIRQASYASLRGSFQAQTKLMARESRCGLGLTRALSTERPITFCMHEMLHSC